MRDPDLRTVRRPDRRLVLASGLAVIGTAGSASGATAVAPSPVDRILVRFVVDGAAAQLARPIRRPGLAVDPAPPSPDHRRRLIAEWGLSLLIETEAAGVRRSVLLDFGFSPEALANNLGLLRIDPSTFDALMLSHGHYDHFGGLPALLSSGGLRPGVPLWIGGEEALCERLRGFEGNLGFGRLDADDLRSAGVDLRVSSEPVVVGGGVTTGLIPLDIERPRTPTRMKPGVGCPRDALDPDKRDAEILEDDSRHELGYAVHLRGRGLVVFGACSHRGILNTIRRARAVTGVDRVHAVIGGFHLVMPQTEADARRTAAVMAELGPDYVVPGHCSGEPFIAAAEALMPGRVLRPYVGHRFSFASADDS